MSASLLLSKKNNDLSLKKIRAMTDEDVIDYLAKLRWGSTTNVVCPKCQIRHQAYVIHSRHQWRCKYCRHTFSVTSGTMFAYRKLPIKTYLEALAKMINTNGLRAISLMTEIETQYKTAFVMLHKFREMMKTPRKMLDGHIQIDGLYTGTKDKRTNKKEDQKRDYRTNPPARKRCLLVVRQLYSEEDKKRFCLAIGGRRTMIFPMLKENSQSVEWIAQRYIAEGSLIETDGDSSYYVLGKRYDWRSVAHAKEYQSDEGVNNNQAESFFSRFRQFYRLIRHCATHYLENYASECVFREDHRKQKKSRQFETVLKCGLARQPCADWCGYHKGSKHRKRAEWIFNGDGYNVIERTPHLASAATCTVHPRSA